ncbi:MAG: tetratricopeptide (TPR) repeat protein [Gammaproteobacteria bacterium]|jgi:tetratricopeptide (TPR) repeat protein
MVWIYEHIQAEALIHLGRFDAARKVLKRAQQHDILGSSHAWLALVEAATGNHQEARKLIQKAEANMPGSTPTGFRHLYNFISTDNGGPNFERAFDALEAVDL